MRTSSHHLFIVLLMTELKLVSSFPITADGSVNIAENSMITDSESVDSNMSNIGCFLCEQLLSVTKKQVGLSQTQLRFVLNAKCKELPAILRQQCFSFISDSWPQIYVSLSCNMPIQRICAALNLCEAEIEYEEKNVKSTSSNFVENGNVIPFSSSESSLPTTTEAFPSEFTNSNKVNGEYPHVPSSKLEKTTTIKNYKSKVDELEWSKRLTCLFCERMLNNAKNYAITAKMEITAYANSTCSNISETKLATRCFLFTDRKIKELAAFVDEQVVEALWCAQSNRC